MRVALALGFVGLLIFMQDPGGGIPFLLGAAYFGWNARNRLAAAATSGVRSTIDTTAQARSTVGAALSRVDFSALGFARALLVVVAGMLFVAALTLVAVALDQRAFWADAGKAGILIVALLAAAYGGRCVLELRAALQAQALWRQLLEGALRFALCGVGLALTVGALVFTARAVFGYVSHDTFAFFSVVLPALCLAAGGAIAFSHRTRFAAWLNAPAILRAALFAQAAGGVTGAVLVIGIAAAHAAAFKGALDLISFFMSGVACGLIAYASAVNARGGDADLRRAMRSYGGVVLMVLSVQVPLVWAGAFAMGERLIQELSILFLFMPFAFVGTTVLSLWTLALGARLYRRSAI